MELDAPHVVFPVPQGHDLTFSAQRQDLQAIRQRIRIHHPGMVCIIHKTSKKKIKKNLIAVQLDTSAD